MAQRDLTSDQITHLFNVKAGADLVWQSLLGEGNQYSLGFAHVLHDTLRRVEVAADALRATLRVGFTAEVKEVSK